MPRRKQSLVHQANSLRARMPAKPERTSVKDVFGLLIFSFIGITILTIYIVVPFVAAANYFEMSLPANITFGFIVTIGIYLIVLDILWQTGKESE